MRNRHAPFGRLCSLFATSAIAVSLQACATSDADYAWPTTQVPVEQLQLIGRMKVGVFYNRLLDKRPSGVTVLKVHVDEDGAVRRVSVLEASGNPKLDESATDAMRAARFKPYRENGMPIAVTAVAPMRFPGGR